MATAWQLAVITGAVSALACAPNPQSDDAHLATRSPAPARVAPEPESIDAPTGETSPTARRWRAPVSGIEFVALPAGEFSMGSPADEVRRQEDERLHAVRITRPFWIAVTEVTQRQWEHVMGDQPSHAEGCPECPVETINAYRIEAFLTALGELEGRRFRLPTEAEWEYACRAGTTTAYNVGAELDDEDANFDARYAVDLSSADGLFRGRPTPVATFEPNAWGLFDMHGNVWEWTSDLHCDYPASFETDPVRRCETELRVIRGGSWLFGADSARCALRYTHRPQDDGPSLAGRGESVVGLASGTCGRGQGATTRRCKSHRREVATLPFARNSHSPYGLRRQERICGVAVPRR